jgi:hypothetical protein
MTQPLPMVTPGRIVARAPIHTPSPTLIGNPYAGSLKRRSLVPSWWVDVMNATSGPTPDELPIVIGAKESKKQWDMMIVSRPIVTERPSKKQPGQIQTVSAPIP